MLVFQQSFRHDLNVIARAQGRTAKQIPPHVIDADLTVGMPLVACVGAAARAETRRRPVRRCVSIVIAKGYSRRESKFFRLRVIT